jgi:hypothetical protein
LAICRIYSHSHISHPHHTHRGLATHVMDEYFCHLDPASVREGDVIFVNTFLLCEYPHSVVISEDVACLVYLGYPKGYLFRLRSLRVGAVVGMRENCTHSQPGLAAARRLEDQSSLHPLRSEGVYCAVVAVFVINCRMLLVAVEDAWTRETQRNAELVCVLFWGSILGLR